MEEGKDEVLDVKSLYVFPSDTSIKARLLSIAHEGCCRPEQLSSVGSAYRKLAFQPSAFRRLFIGFQPSAENQLISMEKGCYEAKSISSGE